VSVPAGIRAGNYAFRGCTGLSKVIYREITPPSINSNMFKDVTLSPIKLYVPAQSVDAYKAANVWKDFDVQAMPFILDNTSITLDDVGASKTLNVEFDEEYTGNKTITWSSGNPAVVSVNNGMLTAKANGTALITATAGDFSDYCVVSVGKTNSGTPIREIKKSDGRVGIRLTNSIVSDKAEFEVILPDNDKAQEIKAVVYDNTGNVVFETSGKGKLSWNLTNNAGRNVANGTYLIVAQAKGAKGTYAYSAKVGVKK